MKNPDRDELVKLADEAARWKVSDIKNPDDVRAFAADVETALRRLASSDGGVKVRGSDLRKMWRDAGGEFYGPHVETGSMPESKLLPFLRSLISVPADAGMREAFVRVLASLAAAISILERTPKAKKAVASDKMFDTMLDDYRKALEIGRAALTAPGATPARCSTNSRSGGSDGG